jgi:deoxyribonuclease V
MEIHHLHSFTVTYGEALSIQHALREKLNLQDTYAQPPTTVAGADISCEIWSNHFFASVLLYRYPDMTLIEEAHADQVTDFPYIPGMLSFREGPALLQAFAKLKRSPDIAIFDGQGIAHPRGLGLASHMGLFLNIPTIGCAKTRLWGSHGEVGEEAGERVPLTHDSETIGYVVRTKTRVKPLFISPGQGISRERAVDVVLSCCCGYRLPEPVRNAHLAVNRFRQQHLTAP